MDSFYDALALYYDQMQSDMDCGQVCSYVISLIERFSPRKPLEDMDITDLGCGTGEVAVLLSGSGANVTGIDNAPGMLSVAADKDPGSKVMWVLQDITGFELPYGQDVIISLTDTLDHIMSEDALRRLFHRVSENLVPSGLFIFDVITEHHLKDILADNIFYEDYDDFTLLWVNSYNEDTRTNTAELTLFEAEDDGRYLRYDGSLEERFYPVEVFMDAAKEAGLEYKGLFGNLSFEEPSEDEERVFMVFAKEESKDE